MTPDEHHPDSAGRAAGNRLTAPGGRTGPAIADTAADGSAQHAALDARLSAVEAAVEHLESALEGLQDAVHRRSLLDDQRNHELRHRTTHGPGEGSGPDDRDAAP